MTSGINFRQNLVFMIILAKVIVCPICDFVNEIKKKNVFTTGQPDYKIYFRQNLERIEILAKVKLRLCWEPEAARELSEE